MRPHRDVKGHAHEYGEGRIAGVGASMSHVPLFSFEPPPQQARRRAAQNRVEYLEKVARNKLASPIPTVVSQLFPITLPNAEQLKHSLVQIFENANLEKQLQELQAQVAALTMIIASRNESAVAQSSLAVIEGRGHAAAHEGLTSDDPACECDRRQHNQRRRFSI